MADGDDSWVIKGHTIETYQKVKENFCFGMSVGGSDV